jgi:crotonobetainyl-CoA:carnitine CoA-transferase CaiB-like acyl-CoA transferase
VAVPGDELKFPVHAGEDTATATVPALGADAATVLCEIGYNAAEVDQLRASGVVL